MNFQGCFEVVNGVLGLEEMSMFMSVWIMRAWYWCWWFFKEFEMIDKIEKCGLMVRMAGDIEILIGCWKYGLDIGKIGENGWKVLGFGSVVGFIRGEVHN